MMVLLIYKHYNGITHTWLIASKHSRQKAINLNQHHYVTGFMPYTRKVLFLLRHGVYAIHTQGSVSITSRGSCHTHARFCFYYVTGFMPYTRKVLFLLRYGVYAIHTQGSVSITSRGLCHTHARFCFWSYIIL